MNTRRWTNALIDARDEGIVSDKSIANAALAYLSERDVQDMIKSWELLPDYMIDELSEDED